MNLQTKYNYRPPNPLANKEFLLKSLNPESTEITVSSPFLGQWTFTLDDIKYNVLCDKLNEWCTGELTIQEVFPNLTTSQRENFISNPAFRF